MSVKEKQQRICSLFEHLTSVSRGAVPVEQRDPRLHGVGKLAQGELFSCFHEKVLAEATKLYETLYAAKDFDDFMNLAKQARSFVNEGLFVYAASVAILHRADCRGVTVPPIQEIFPDRFVPSETIILALKEVQNHPDKDIVVEIESTGNILDPEYRMSYFREDVETNAHHWHWHIVYPATWRPEVMGKHKDRKGELFYYMHQQMCARYDCERLSNGMRRMIPFHNFEEELEGYSAHLTSLVSGLQYASRPEGFHLHDLKDVDVQDMIRWRERIIEAIHIGYVEDENHQQIPLTEENGVDILGAIVESSYESKNKLFYGSLHNWGHVMMAKITDPDGRFNENPGVMSDTSTSLRDPIFYRYHRFIDNIFQEYKSTLKPYTKEQLEFPGVHVVNVTVNAKLPNLVTTFMKTEELELTHGIDFGTAHSVKVRYHHLDHEPFTFNISVDNQTGGPAQATVRIFLGPKYDELGNRLDPEHQRGLCIEIDKFQQELAPGKNSIARDHKLSSVTVSEKHTFKQLKAGEGVSENTTEFCSCGWPEHMLIPRGSHKGSEFDLFVMLTDYSQDAVEGEPVGVCTDAISYCGAKDHKYPDKRPMGFPFDRVITASTIAEFLVPNMSCTDVKIKHQGHPIRKKYFRPPCKAVNSNNAKAETKQFYEHDFCAAYLRRAARIRGSSPSRLPPVAMPAQDRQHRILPLFEHLTSLTRSVLPPDERDPRLKRLGRLPRGTLFSCFHTEHLIEAEELYEILHGAKDFDDLIRLAEQARDIVNEGLFVYAVSVAILHRDDCRGVTVPPIQEIFPDRFIPAETINQAVKLDLHRTEDGPLTVDIIETGNILDSEHKLAYFREDIGANAHHWHWHIVYPATWRPQIMGKVKDRKGELFYYMHQQMCARYDCDRLSIGLQRMIPFQNFDEKLEGYSPHLTSLVSGHHYANRPSGMSLHDLNELVDVLDMTRWRERLLQAIHLGVLVDDHGNEVILTPEHGIDMLGAMLESSYESKNREYYGNLHNSGHVMMARIHDPDGRYKESPGVMSDTSTSLRDPIFYRYHRFIDNIFQEYKATLPVYDKKDLDFPGVTVVNVTVNAKVPNIVNTFMKEDHLELSYGISLKGPVKVKYQHLDHEPFTYSISVENTTGATKHATVRIFLGPIHDELGNKLSLNEQRRFFIELDKFHHELAAGKNTVTRKSTESSVTVASTPSFSKLQSGEGVSENSTEFCSCGWPEHLLVPRGNHKGMDFYLFVMLTDYEQDHVNGLNDKSICADAVSYCGAKDQKYPDKKAMGFPFDRVIKARTVSEFSSHNMSFTEVKIQFKEA
ncbi:uncharacterized protein LOC129231152 [Uloborus diversus]|uniref:uncharacterized protein LOC129231152 n=1 Tax=Uloborus diversus TaxID=327109 RepID=UPI00240A3009|nr:uncharacterized protein LOC129231152 [Uloborus diversus]